ncbi:MAG: PilZ domain-containing protein [Thermodesulfobacteriota bacterium]
MQEKREFIRLESLNLLDYQIVDDHGQYAAHSMGRTLDVSEQGLLLESEQEINNGDSLIVTIGLEDDLIELLANVTHVVKSDKLYHAGMKFDEVDKEGERVLKKYIDAFLKMFGTPDK